MWCKSTSWASDGQGTPCPYVLPTPHSPLSTLHSPLPTPHSPLSTLHSPLPSSLSPLTSPLFPPPDPRSSIPDFRISFWGVGRVKGGGGRLVGVVAGNGVKLVGCFVVKETKKTILFTI